jgi:TolB-like protein
MRPIHVLAALVFFAVPSALAQDRELSDAAAKLSQQILQSGRKTVAVANFSNAQGYGAQFSDYVVDELGTLLAGSAKGFDVVTRSRLNQIMDERRLKFGSNFDPATFQQLGKLAGADAIVGGSYRVLGSTVALNLQILDVSKGTIIAGVICNIPRTKDVDELLGTPSSISLPRPGLKTNVQSQAENVLPSPDSFHPAEAIDDNLGTKLGSYKCKIRADLVVCYLLITRTGYGSHDYTAITGTSDVKLIDNFNAEHQEVHIYFVNGKGQQQKNLSLGQGDAGWLAIEFGQASADITSARIVFTNTNLLLHISVE